MFVDFKMSISVSIEYNYTLYRKAKTPPEHSASDTGLTRILGSSCEARESLEVQEEEPEVHSGDWWPPRHSKTLCCERKHIILTTR